MIDIKLIRTNPELVKENIKKKFQDEKLVLVDEVAQFDEEYRAAKTKADELRNKRKVMSKQIGGLMAKGQKDEAEKVKAEVSAIGAELDAMAEKEKDLEAKIRERMLVIPNIIDPSVPIGKDDSENVEIERFGEPVVPDFRRHQCRRHRQGHGYEGIYVRLRITGFGGRGLRRRRQRRGDVVCRGGGDCHGQCLRRGAERRRLRDRYGRRRRHCPGAGAPGYFGRLSLNLSKI